MRKGDVSNNISKLRYHIRNRTDILDMGNNGKTMDGYPVSKFKLDGAQLNKWMSRRMTEINNIDDDSNSSLEDLKDEDVVDKGKQHSLFGKELMADFYNKYKDIAKSRSVLHYSMKTAAYNYLMEIDNQHQLPKPMGIGKLQGVPNELNLE